MEISKFWVSNVTVVDRNSKYNGKTISILVSDGKIEKIESFEGERSGKVYDFNGASISPGWIDLRANFADPGDGIKEDLISGCNAAAAGGYTGVVLIPETDPKISERAQVQYVFQKTANHVVEVFPLATIESRDRHSLSDLVDLIDSGVKGFSFSPDTTDNAFILQALIYLKDSLVPVFTVAIDQALSLKGLINEGIVNIQLGLKGSPGFAELADLQRKIDIARYTGARIHFSCISVAEGINLIEQAVLDGLDISCDISINHLDYNENNLLEFDTNFKLWPPLRSKENMVQLKRLIGEKAFVGISSDHSPHEEDKKKCDFNLAAFGNISLQTLFAQLLSQFDDDVDKVIDILAYRPRKILNLHENTIQENEFCNFTIFDPLKEWSFDSLENKSRSTNSPLFGSTLKGKALAIINKGNIYIN